MANEFSPTAASSNSPIRVLVVDDFAQWRQYVRSLLEARPVLLAIAEASNGPEAVRKAEELRPDLIFLDVGLPGMNGMAAARQIRKVAPDSKIIILSEETSADIVIEAIRLGALAYVAKARAEIDLRKAIETVLQGKHFVSDGLTPGGCTEN